jgi:hypothetical protein
VSYVGVAAVEERLNAREETAANSVQSSQFLASHDGGSMTTEIIFSLCILVSLGIFFYQIWRRFQLLRSATSVSRFDRIPDRVRAVLVWAFGQRKFVRPNPGAEKSAGWMHFFIFWAFFILGIQIITMFVRAYFPFFVFPGFGLNLLGAPYMLLRDFIEVAALIAVGVGLVRWGITHAPRLYGFLPPESRQRGKSHLEAYVILVFIGIIMLAGLVYDGGRIVAHQNDMQVVREARWAPISMLVGLGLAVFGTSFAVQASNVAWWTHNLVVLFFLDLLPPSKHFHIITAIPNIFFAKLEPKVRHLAHRSVHLEAGPRHVLLHGVWPLLLELPRHGNQETSGATSIATRSAGLPVRASGRDD